MKIHDGLYELKKDVSTPSGYWRAGKRHTLKQWELAFGKISEFSMDEWFIDLEIRMSPTYQRPDIKEIIEDEFERANLHSITYKECAEKVALRYAAAIERTKTSQPPHK